MKNSAFNAIARTAVGSEIDQLFHDTTLEVTSCLMLISYPAILKRKSFGDAAIECTGAEIIMYGMYASGTITNQWNTAYMNPSIMKKSKESCSIRLNAPLTSAA